MEILRQVVFRNNSTHQTLQDWKTMCLMILDDLIIMIKKKPPLIEIICIK